MIDPTYEEWQVALDALADSMEVVHPGCLVPHVEAVLGPCPPEPAPESLRKDCFMLVETCGGVIRARELALTPDEADAMADALREHARLAREQAPAPGPSS